MARVPLLLLVVLVPIGSDRQRGILLRSQSLFPAWVGGPFVASVVIWLAGRCPIA